MSRGTKVTLGVLTAVPIGTCSLAAGAMLIAGEQRLIAIQVALPAGVLGVGALISAIPLAILLRRQQKAKGERKLRASIDAATQAAAQHERSNHQRFLARLDHELKNPLTAIRATAAAAQEDAQSEAWHAVDAQASKLSTLVRDLRKLAELETRPLEPELVSLENVLNEAIDALGHQNPAARARVSLSITQIPWTVPPLSVDLDLFTLAVDNVLGNAAKYSDQGPIEVRLREQDGWAVIEIADAGRGIPASEVPTVFDELARAQNARDVSGSGIGLALVETIMRRHGGDVSIRSVEFAGSVVTLRLPIRY